MKIVVILLLSVFSTCCLGELYWYGQMTADAINSMTKPSDVIANVNCWNTSAKIKLMSMLGRDEITINYVYQDYNFSKKYFSHQTIFLVDISCRGGIDFIQKGNFLKLFDSPFRWLITGDLNIDNTLEQLSNFEINVDSSTVVISKMNEHNIILHFIYKLPCDHYWHLEYYGTWNKSKGLLTSKKMSETTAMRRKNLFGSNVTVISVISDNNTIADLYHQKYDFIDTVTKYNYHTISHLMSFMNATRVDYFVNFWGHFSNGSWSGMMDFFANKKAEIGGTVLFMVKDRLPYVDYISRPTNPALKFVFQQPPLSYHNNLYLLPFSTTVWCSVLVIVLIIIIILFASALCEQKYTRNSETVNVENTLRPNIIDVILFVHSAICQQGSPVDLHGGLGRLVIFVILLMSTFLFTSYSASVVVLLQSSSSQIRTLEDLLNSKLEVAAENTSYNRHYFSTEKEPVRYALYHHKIAPHGTKPKFFDVEEGVKKLQKGQFAFFMELDVGYKFVEKYFDEDQKCRLQEMAYLQALDLWLGARKKSPYKEMFKCGLSRVQEYGLNKREYARLYGKKPKCISRGSNFVSVSMVDCYPALLVLLYGFGVSSLLLILELLIHRYHTRRIM